MFLKQFQYLIALEHEGHFGRAAERCFVSQPSLSSGLKKLENELDIPIILRGRRFQGFTREGKCVVEWAKRLMADRNGMLDDLAILQKNLHGRLRIGAMPTSSPMLPTVARLMLNHYPSVQIDIQFMGIDRLIQALKNFELDIGITDLDQLFDTRLETQPLYEEPFHLLLPNDGWLGQATEVTWADAARLPLCLLSRSMRERQIMDEAFATVACKPEPQLESNSIFQLALYVAAGDLATIVPRRFTEQTGACSKLLINPVVKQQLGLVWVTGDPVLPMTKAAIDLITQALEDGLFAYNSDSNSKEPGISRL